MRRPICLIAASFGTGIFFGFYMELSKLAVLIFVYTFILYFISKHNKFSPSQYVNGLCGINLKNMMCLALLFFLSGALCLLIHVNKKDHMLSFADQYTRRRGV